MMDAILSDADGSPGPHRSPVIGIIAGEVSGDLLGARLIRSLRSRFPDATFVGIGGAEMQAEGCKSLFPIEKLSVLGLTEILGRFFELHRIRRALVEYFKNRRPDIFIGIDSPGFNLGLEQELKESGILTVHYVSPQVWAWRTWRVRKIRRAVDRILVLFPFEESFYARHDVEATYIGHPLADEIRAIDDPRPYRDRLQLDPERQTVALLPGSRTGEVKALADTFVQTAQWLHSRHPELQFVAPFVNRKTRILFEQAVERQGAWDLPIYRMHGHSRSAMAAADVVLLASGTATLEAMLLGRLMVVTYRVSAVTYWLMRAFAHIRLVAMPNHLAGRHLVPELLQHHATPEALGRAIERYLPRPLYAREVLHAFADLGNKLRGNAMEKAAEVISGMLRQHARPSFQNHE